MKRIYIYCGAHKTASSMIRRFLNRESKVLLDKYGVFECGREAMMKTPFFDVIRKLSRGEDVSDSQYEAGSESFEDLCSLVADADSILLHNEDLFSPMFFNNAHTIAGYLAKLTSSFEERRVVLYIRRQPDYVESWFMQQIHVGMCARFDSYIRRQDLAALSWWNVLSSINLSFERSEIVCKPYETISSGSLEFLREFLRIVSLGDISLDGYNCESVNRSYSKKAYDMAMACYPILDVEEKKVFRQFLQKSFSTKTHPRARFFSDDERIELLKMHNEGNRRVFDRYIEGLDPVVLGYAV